MIDHILKNVIEILRSK